MANPRRTRCGHTLARFGLAASLILSGPAPAQTTDVIQDRIDAFRASDIVFPRSTSNVPFIPVAFLNASSYGEAQISDNRSGESISFEQRGGSAMAGFHFLPTSRDMLLAGTYLSSFRFTSDDSEREDFTVTSIGVPVAWLRQVNPRWQGATFVMPFAHYNTRADGEWNVQTMAGAFARYTRNERLWWVFGVFGDYNQQESYVLPYVGASWTINRRWALSAVMPWPTLHYAPTQDWLFSLGASPSGAAWSQSASGNRVAVSLDAWDFGLTVERRVRGPLWLSARAGVGGLRGLRVSTEDGGINDPDIDVGASGFLSISLKIRPQALP